MSLYEKSEKNKDVAYSLCDMEYYNAAANRFYYSCYQRLYQLAVDKMQYKKKMIMHYKDNTKKKKGSHELLIDTVDETINLLMKDKDEEKALNIMRARSIKSVYNKLKKYRTQADYNDKEISQDDIEDLKDNFEKFENYFSIIQELFKE